MKGRTVLIACFMLSLLPILAAQAVWQWWRPVGGNSFGELLATPIAAPGPWRLAAADAACGDVHSKLLFAAGQLRLAQGEASQRMVRASFCPSNSADIAYLPSHAPSSGLYLIDPHGNAVLRYSTEQLSNDDGRRKALKEIGQVLKNNKALG
ncbi:hypothetical protein R6242_12390 [Iodobacter sp. CM08]|uniref:hypothetical protein n=1 Tax=Iodobacter sp. CM08 TaxID=3085902 RepID=UPI002981440B|nr:hypothetical protein [Iodobacter sp. CM08]MDW5417367.1 hypothetical protein [Iodobacter sp. CM08]